MKVTEHDERREEPHAALEALSADRDDATPVDEVLAQLRDTRHIVASERNQNRVSRPHER